VVQGVPNDIICEYYTGVVVHAYDYNIYPKSLEVEGGKHTYCKSKYCFYNRILLLQIIIQLREYVLVVVVFVQFAFHGTERILIAR